jgi:SAM-dependent methyltransferase
MDAVDATPGATIGDAQAVGTPDPRRDFHTSVYHRLNRRRMEHLATLDLPLRERTVLEVGAGIGDLTDFFLDRGCRVTAVDGRATNVAVLEQRFADVPAVSVATADLNDPPAWSDRFDVVFADGILYHLAAPSDAIAWMADRCTDLLIVSTCVSLGDDLRVDPAEEDPRYASQALDGCGCRPTRRWVFETLAAHLPHVYTTVTQPNHEEFPLAWDDVRPPASGLSRAVFVASRRPLPSSDLVAELPRTHEPAS